MTNDEINERIAKITGFHDKVGLKKRGLWWRPNAQGYTSNESGAGRYTLKEAEDYAHPDGEPVTIHKFTTPDYTGDLNACRQFESTMSRGALVYYYHGILARTLWKKNPDSDESNIRIALLTAPPAVRCEAFIETYKSGIS